MKRFLVAAAAVALLFTVPAFAQDARPPVDLGDEAPTDPNLGVPVASAEPTSPPATSDGLDFTPIATTVKESFIAILIAALTAATGWLTAQISRWTSGKIRLEDTLRDLHMEDYARRAADKAFNYGLSKVGITWSDLTSVEIKNQVARYGLDFLLSQYPEVVEWLDKDNNGVVDWLETLLPTYQPSSSAGLTGASTLKSNVTSKRKPTAKTPAAPKTEPVAA